MVVAVHSQWSLPWPFAGCCHIIPTYNVGQTSAQRWGNYGTEQQEKLHGGRVLELVRVAIFSALYISCTSWGILSLGSCLNFVYHLQCCLSFIYLNFVNKVNCYIVLHHVFVHVYHISDTIAAGLWYIRLQCHLWWLSGKHDYIPVSGDGCT